MALALSEATRACEEHDVRVWDRPITFEEFLDLYMGREEIVELVDGCVVERPMVQLDHEKLVTWLLRVLGQVAEERDLGLVLGSRSAVKISERRGRLPDLFFVKRGNLDAVQQRATYAAPDLIMEVRSPSDYPSRLVALEVDYQDIGTGEIVFIDLQKRSVRVLRKRESGYEHEELTSGTLRLESMGGAQIPFIWIFDEPRPRVREAVDALLGE